MRTLAALLAICASACVPAAAAAADAPAQPAGSGQTVLKRLSNLRTSSVWAYPQGAVEIHASPTSRSRSLGRLALLTSDGQAQLYVALASARLPSGAGWLQIEVPGRPNGRTGWVPRGALGTLNPVDSYLKIDERTLTATLFRRGHAIFSARVGIGKASTVTPTGRFYVMEKLRPLNAPVYGPFAIGTSAYAPTLSEWPGGGVVGIHGTNEPQLIPGRPSHGCIRMRDSDIARLWATIGLGTPIEIV
ncbi:MAG TPA: L,D-transpeptidase [Solirubrobacteraceae bacterium]